MSSEDVEAPIIQIKNNLLIKLALEIIMYVDINHSDFDDKSVVPSQIIDDLLIPFFGENLLIQIKHKEDRNKG